MKAPSKGIPDDHLPKLRFPIIASPKLDGLRVLHHEGRAVTSSLKPVKNKHTFELCSHHMLSGLDGEMAVGDGMDPAGFKNAISAVMAEDGKYDITWWVFDICDNIHLNAPFEERHRILKDRVRVANMSHVKVIPHVLLHTMEQLLEYEAEMLHKGFEGVMLRDPKGRYKYDRSTLNEGLLLKLKRGNVKRGDAVVVGFTERMRNENEATINERGLQERSSHKANLIGRGDLGSFQVRDTETGYEFSIGTGDGLNDALRREIWNNQEAFLGKTIRYEWFAYGGYDKPRFPKFIAFRPEEDLGLPE